MINLKSNDKAFEVSLWIRDKDGNPLTQKSYSSDKAYKISEFWDRNSTIIKKKKKRITQASKINEAVAQETAQTYFESTEYKEKFKEELENRKDDANSN